MAINNQGIPSISGNVDIDEQIIDNVIGLTDKVTADEDSSVADMSRTAIFKGAADTVTNVNDIKDLYNAVSGVSDLDEYDQLGIIRKYVEDSLPAPDYKKFIKEPSGALPLYALSASLKNSEIRGDTNAKKLINAASAYMSGKGKEAAAFDAQRKQFEYDRQTKIDQIAKELFVSSVKNKNELAKKIVDDVYLGTRKLYYQQGSDGQVDYDNPVFLSNVEANRYITQNGVSSLRPAETDDDKLDNVRVETTNPDGTVTIVEEFLPAYKVREMEKDANTRITKPRGDTNGKSYLITDADGKTRKEFLNVDQYNNLQKDVDSGLLKEVVAIPSGTGRYVDTEDNGTTITLTHEQALADPERYVPFVSTFTYKTNPDGTTEISQNASGSSGRTAFKDGQKLERETFDKADNIASNVMNFHNSNQEIRNIIGDYEKRGLNPNELFSDATIAASLGTRIVKDFQTFTSLLTTPLGENVSGTDLTGSGTRFIIADTISNDMGISEIEQKQVPFEEFKNSILSNDDFISARDTFMNGDLAKKLLAANVSRDTIEAAFFDLALQSASTYSKGDGLDLRAMSDKDVVFNIKNIGGDASTLEGFIAVNNRFTRGLINRNIKKLENMYNNYPLLDSIVKGDGVTIDQERVEKLRSQINNKIEELKGIAGDYTDNPLDLVFGVASRPYELDDNTKIDMSGVFLTPDMLQDPNRARALADNFNITNLTQNYDTNTTLSNGQSVAQLIMQYQTFLNNGDTERLDIFTNNLQKRISPEEYSAFNFFNRVFANLKQDRIEELQGN